MESKTKWYENKPRVTVLSILFWPMGLYGLWKNAFNSVQSKEKRKGEKYCELCKKKLGLINPPVEER